MTGVNIQWDGDADKEHLDYLIAQAVTQNKKGVFHVDKDTFFHNGIPVKVDQQGDHRTATVRWK